MTKFTDKTERIFNRALEIIKHTEIPNDYFVYVYYYIPFPSDMFHLIGYLSDFFRNKKGEFEENKHVHIVLKEWIETNNDSISSSDVILESKTEYEALYYYMAKVIGNIESGHIKVRRLR
jgi:hypothetical protein